MKNPLLFFILIFTFISASLLADYKSNMAAGNQSYKAGDFEAALKYYEQVLE